MVTKKQVLVGLKSGKMTLELSEWGDGMRGIGLYLEGNNAPIERIAICPWHIDQDDTLQYADKDFAGWYRNIFRAGSLSTKARQMLQAHCEEHEEVIMAWIDGDQDAILPALA